MARRMLTLLSLVVLLVVGVAQAATAPATGQVVPPLTRPSEEPPPSDAPPSEEPAPEPAQPEFPPLPEDSGAGRRIVYSVSEQRVWLVEHDETVVASWLVSGRKGIPGLGRIRSTPGRAGARPTAARSAWRS